MIYIFLAEGFEEIEAVATIDILRRTNLDVKIVGVGSEYIKGSMGITLKSDIELSELVTENLQGIVLPGGILGVENLSKNDKVCEIIRYCDKNKLLIGAICAAPSILGQMKILEGKEACCYPGFEKSLIGTKISKNGVCVCDNIITSNGPGNAINFALKLVEYIFGVKEYENIKLSMNI